MSTYDEARALALRILRSKGIDADFVFPTPGTYDPVLDTETGASEQRVTGVPVVLLPVSSRRSGDGNAWDRWLSTYNRGDLRTIYAPAAVIGRDIAPLESVRVETPTAVWTVLEVEVLAPDDLPVLYTIRAVRAAAAA